MDIKYIIERIRKESREYLESHKAADDWVMSPEKLLINILVDEIANIQQKVDVDGFTKGIVYACARMIEMHDQPTMALEIYDEAGCIDETVASEYDLQYLRKYRPSFRKGKI